MNNEFIYGKNKLEAVTSVEIDDNVATIYTADNKTIQTLNEFYILYPDNNSEDLIRLRGNLYYKYVKKFQDYQEYQGACAISRAKKEDYFTIYNPKESFMVKTGVTYYKGLKPNQVTVLSFDIETTGLNNKTNQVLLIANTFRDASGNITRKLFSLDEYNNEKEMVYAWCNFVREHNPSVILGHNIFGFDFPFLRARADRLPIGREGQDANFAKRTSEFRKDGSQSYEYNNVLVRGREIIDTFHLSIKYDIQRNYPSYKLKEIIKYEGLERSDRQYYDALKIKDAFYNKEEWDKVKKYAEHDADDALALFDLMIPSYFYYTQTIPKTLQQVVNGATGAQVNSFMVRAYLGEAHSIPKATDALQYEGAISYGNAGIYSYVGKYDVASLYPSIILQEKIYDEHKDPKGYFLKMVEYFTTERLRNKRLAKETGERYYKDLEQSQKIVINSAYGFLGAPGLTFNSPINAASITRHGRSILQRGIEWAEQKGFRIVNADTDSFSFTADKEFSLDQYQAWLKELNSLYPERIKWEEDGIYKRVVVVKAKNYILQETCGKTKIKGSALKATMKEPALIEFINSTINCILDDRISDIKDLYHSVVYAIHHIDKDSIHKWSSKKTITKSVLQPSRTNEARVKDAIIRAGLSVQEGDKIFVYFKDDETLSLSTVFDGKYCVKTLLGKLYNTIKIFETILDIKEYPNYTLKKNQVKLQEFI